MDTLTATSPALLVLWLLVAVATAYAGVAYVRMALNPAPTAQYATTETEK
jgi:hypothetical protein